MIDRKKRRLAKMNLFLCSFVMVFLAMIPSQTLFAQKKPVITLVTHQSPALEHFARTMEGFPEVSLKKDVLEFDKYVTKARIALSGKSSGYDIVWGDHQIIQEFAANGWLQPLDDYVKKYWAQFNFGDYSEATWNALTYKGHSYAIPSSGNIWFLYCRTDLFEEAGIAYPPATLDAVIEAAKKLNQPGKRYGIDMTLNRGINCANTAQYFIRLYGGSWVDEDLNPNFGGEAGRKGLEKLKELVKYAPPGVLTHSNNEVTVSMQQDRAAMAFLWASRAGTLDDPKNSKVVGKVKFYLPPPLAKGEVHHSLSFVEGYGISRFSKNNPDTLFKTLSYGTSRESQFKGAEILLPTRLPVLGDAQLMEKVRFFPAAAQGFKVGLKPAESIPQASEFYSIVSIYIHKAISGEMDIDKALAGATEEAREFLQSRK